MKHSKHSIVATIANILNDIYKYQGKNVSQSHAWCFLMGLFARKTTGHWQQLWADNMFFIGPKSPLRGGFLEAEYKII